jgi:formylglycine-generating enzyme required for sulfatase activity
VYLDEFSISKYEITYSQFDEFCNATGKQKPYREHVESKNYPVIYISWFDAMDFCKWLSQMTGELISLPTEAQWEKAARGGQTGDTYIYQSEDMPVKGFPGHPTELLELYEWFSFNSNEDYHPVGLLKPNQFGIHDILGNVSEWCFDLFDENYYRVSKKNNPQGPTKNENGYRVVRGGNYSTDYKLLRCSYRRGCQTDANSIGFRIVKNLNKS